VHSDTDEECHGIDNVNEGVEFSVRITSGTSDGLWIPLRLSYFHHSTTIKFRGYVVDVNKNQESRFSEVVSVCGEVLK